MKNKYLELYKFCVAEKRDEYENNSDIEQLFVRNVNNFVSASCRKFINFSFAGPNILIF